MLSAQMSQTDLSRIAAKFGFTAKETETVVARALNDVAKTARGRIRKSVRAYLNVRAKSVNDRVDIGRRARPGELRATVDIDKLSRSRARPTLMSFGGKPKEPWYEGKKASLIKRRAAKQRAATGRRGVTQPKPFTYQIVRGGSRDTLQGAFVARISTGNAEGNVLDFKRVGRKRYPLVVPKGPSVAAVFQNAANGVGREALADLPDLVASRIEGQSQRLLNSQFKKVSGQLQAVNSPGGE